MYRFWLHKQKPQLPTGEPLEYLSHDDLLAVLSSDDTSLETFTDVCRERRRRRHEERKLQATAKKAAARSQASGLEMLQQLMHH